MRRVLTINYSQTGQLASVLKAVTTPLENSEFIEVEHLVVEPETPFPFPWPFLEFFRRVPETVLMEPVELKPFKLKYDHYDLIILSYQPWFLSPSLPISSLLQSPEIKQAFDGTPVVTLIACRSMWLTAQEKVKSLLNNLNAKLVDNVVLTDECGDWPSFLATPLWMFTGKKKAFSWVPAAGVSEESILDAEKFGHAIVQRIESDTQPIDSPMLKGLGAVKINEKLIASERVGQRSFNIWSRLLKKCGPTYSRGRTLGLCVYIVFLLTLILTLVPVVAIIKKLLAPITRKRISEQKHYYAKPSGE